MCPLSFYFCLPLDRHDHFTTFPFSDSQRTSQAFLKNMGVVTEVISPTYNIHMPSYHLQIPFYPQLPFRLADSSAPSHGDVPPFAAQAFTCFSAEQLVQRALASCLGSITNSLCAPGNSLFSFSTSVFLPVTKGQHLTLALQRFFFFS